MSVCPLFSTIWTYRRSHGHHQQNKLTDGVTSFSLLVVTTRPLCDCEQWLLVRDSLLVFHYSVAVSDLVLCNLYGAITVAACGYLLELLERATDKAADMQYVILGV